MKAIQHFLLLIVLSTLGNLVHGQDEIKFTPAFRSSDVVATEGAINSLKNKFKAQTKVSTYFSDQATRFLLVINPTKLAIQTTGGQVMIKYNLQFELYDLLADQIFHSFAVTMAGVGKTEHIAFAVAVDRLNFRNELFKNEMEEGISKLLSYYEQNCERILTKATLLKDTQQYPEAFAQLSLVPNLANSPCLERYDAIFTQLWKEYSKHHCENIISQANLLWAADPSKEGATAVATFLQGLDLNGRCHDSFQQLINRIREKLMNDEFDEKEFRRMIISGEIEIEKSKLNAISKITSAYYNSLVSDNYIIVD